MTIRSLKTPSFNKAFEAMPKEIQDMACETFLKWRERPDSIKIKSLAAMSHEVYSAEINYRYRALGVRAKDKNGVTTYVWFWVGSHESYNKLVSGYASVRGQVQKIREKFLCDNRPQHTPTPINY